MPHYLKGNTRAHGVYIVGLMLVVASRRIVTVPAGDGRISISMPFEMKGLYDPVLPGNIRQFVVSELM